MNYDYILVVDTEGLRAPELKDTNRTHDNELATFVVGLANLTIVNIKGGKFHRNAECFGNSGPCHAPYKICHIRDAAIKP